MVLFKLPSILLIKNKEPLNKRMDLEEVVDNDNIEQQFSDIPDGGLIIPSTLIEEPMIPQYIEDFFPRKIVSDPEERIIQRNMNLMWNLSPLTKVFKNYKTQMCKGKNGDFSESCNRQHCAFAHSIHELRTVKQNTFDFRNSCHPLIL